MQLRTTQFLPWLVIIFVAACQKTPIPTPSLSPSLNITATAIPQSTTVSPSSTSTIQPTLTAIEVPRETRPTTSFQTSSINYVRFFNETSAWATDTLGNILYTTSGPGPWQNVSPPGAKPGVGPTQVVSFFLDLKHAWVLYRPQPGAPMNTYTVWSTNDSGQTWQKSQPIYPQGEGILPISLFFTDSGHGWFLGQAYPGMHNVYALLFATQDGGLSWSLVSDSSFNPATALPGSYSLPYGAHVFSFIDRQTGFAGIHDLYSTTDGGRTWAVIELPPPPDAPNLANPDYYVSPPQFSTPSDGILIYNIHLADNVYCPPCDVSFTLPAAIYIYTTHDAGQTWNPVPAPENTGLAGLTDAEHGWFLGRQNLGDSFAYLHTTSDGGNSWLAHSNAMPFPVCASLNFASPQTIYAYNPYAQIGQYPIQDAVFAPCSKPFLYQSTDGGNSWQPITVSPVP